MRFELIKFKLQGGIFKSIIAFGSSAVKRSSGRKYRRSHAGYVVTCILNELFKQSDHVTRFVAATYLFPIAGNFIF